MKPCIQCGKAVESLSKGKCKICYMKEYNKRPEVVRRAKLYRQRLYVKEKQRIKAKEYSSRPDVRKKRKEYFSRPDVKKKVHAYQRMIYKIQRKEINESDINERIDLFSGITGFGLRKNLYVAIYKEWLAKNGNIVHDRSRAYSYSVYYRIGRIRAVNNERVKQTINLSTGEEKWEFLSGEEVEELNKKIEEDSHKRKRPYF